MKQWSIGAKMTVVSAVGILISFGLCGLSQGEISKGVGLFGTMLFVFSMMGLMFGAVVWMVMGLAGDDE